MGSRISIRAVRIHNVDRLGRMSAGSTMQIGNHVKNHRVEGFGEHNADRGTFHFPKFFTDDSDAADTNAEKRG